MPIIETYVSTRHKVSEVPFCHQPEIELFDWGEQYNKIFDMDDSHLVGLLGQRPFLTLPSTLEPVCPVCKKFSAFSFLGESYARDAREKWMRAVIGFVASKTPSYAGILTIHCPVHTCQNKFTFPLSHGLVEAYRNASPAWKRAERKHRLFAKHSVIDDPTRIAVVTVLREFGIKTDNLDINELWRLAERADIAKVLDERY